MNIKFDKIKNGIIHVQVAVNEEYGQTLLTKYGFFFDEQIRENANDNFTGKDNGNSVFFTDGKKDLSMNITGFRDSEFTGKGFSLKIDVDNDESFYGLGDETREATMKRGRIATMWVSNVTSYGPIPFLYSSKGWGILVNSTYRHEYDLACSEKDKINISSPKGCLDFYVFMADSIKEMIDLYTQLTGRPIMLPKSAYGLVFVNNEEEGAREMLENCYHFRREDIPCDIMGLEPGWMSKHYDLSTNKKWDEGRFYIPYWEPINYSGTWSFFYNLREMEFDLTLWLCCDYDLLWHEENDFLKTEKNSFEGAAITDEHLILNATLSDNVTVQGEPWFEHLKKFVDQGATGFKLDAARQVLEHPDRLWAGRYTDDEVHNVYGLIYSRQMNNGYVEYTGRRPLIYTPHLYAGAQHYATTWAGDTGGLDDTMGYIQNMSLCGHTNTSCDMDISREDSMHFAFLLPWTQLLAWRNWHHPWFLSEKRRNMIRYYSKLRSSLFPYIYSYAYKASQTGLAVVRPLCLQYEGKKEYDNVLNTYMFGDSLLIGSFDMNITLPEGSWYDYFTGDVYEGNQKIEYKVPKGKGGALFAKMGSVFVTQEPKSHIKSEDPDLYKINIFPGADSAFDLYDDDGITLDYLEGKINLHRFDVKNTSNGFDLIITKVNDSYKRERENTLEAIVYASSRPEKILCEGKEISFEYNECEKKVYAKLEKSLEDIESSVKYEFIF